MSATTPSVDALSDALQRSHLSPTAAASPPPIRSPSRASIASTASNSSSSSSSHPLSPSVLSAMDDIPSASPANSALPFSTGDNETDELYGDLASAAAFFTSPIATTAYHHSHYLHAGLPPLPVLPPDLRSIVKSLQVISSELRLDKSLPALIAIITQQAGATRGIMLSKADEVNAAAMTGTNSGYREATDGAVEGEGVEEAEWIVEASANAEVRDSTGELLNMPPSPLGSTALLSHSFSLASSSVSPTVPNSARSSSGTSAAVPSASASLSPSSLQQSSKLTPFSQPLASPSATPLQSPLAQTDSASASSTSHSASSFSQHAPHMSDSDLSNHTPYPTSIVQYCIRSKKSVLLSDALSDTRFGRDPYVIAHSIRSILCTPLLHRDKLVSILYLESGVGNAFTSDRLVVCRLLCQQAAISIDNARLYAQLARSNELLELKVAQRTRELEEATRLANEANRMKSSFLANMSHEIRTPMNGVLGGASLLVETSNNLTVEQKEIVHIIRTSGEVMLTLINDILDLSKIEAGRVELDYTVFSLRGCIEGALDVLAEKASRKRVELLYSTGAGVADMVVGDALRLRQIVINLLSNAVKFTDRGEVLLYVETMEDDDHADHPHPSHSASSSRRSDSIASAFSTPAFPHSTAAPVALSHMPPLQRVPSTRPHLPGERSHLFHIAVRDTGIGIPQKALPHLFQSFNQVSSKEQQRQFGGTGLGLSISRQLCELMGGRMWVESEEGVGSVFHFTFRVWASVEGSPSYLQGVAAELAGKRMLLVKGSEKPASMIAGMCEQWGMQTILARNMAEVETALKAAEHIDVVLVDFELDSTADDGSTDQPSQPGRKTSGNEPDEQPSTASGAPSASASSSSSSVTGRPTGLDVAQLVRRSFPAGQSPTVLMLCALSQRQRSMRAVVDAFLSKPVKPSKLFAALVATQRPKLSQVIMGAAAAGSTSPVLNAANLPPLAPLVNWAPIDSLVLPTSKHSTMTSASSAQQTGGASAASTSNEPQPDPMHALLYTQQQPQAANGKRKRDNGPENNSVSPPAGFFSLSSPSSASPGATPSFPSSPVTSPTSTLLSRHSKPGRLSASALGSSIWSPPATSTSPILGDDSHQFFTKHPMRILAAEDNLINQKVLARMLDRLGWPQELVTIVPNGRLAWDGVVAAAAEDELSGSGGSDTEKEVRGDSNDDLASLGRRLRKEPYHLVFMDIYMPVLDGLDATVSIRSDTRISASAQPYVVALTANAMAGDKQKCLESGFDFFLSKPVTLGPLMQALRTGFATMCKKRKQLLARQQREDGSRHERQEEAGDDTGDVTGRRGGAGSGSAGSDAAKSEGRTAGAELRRRGVEQSIISPSVRPNKLAQLGSGTTSFVTSPPQRSSTIGLIGSPRSAAARLSSAASGTSPLSTSRGVLVTQSTSELPTLSFARISSAPLSALNGRMLATSQQLQLLANIGHTPASPLVNRDGERAINAGSGRQTESALMSSTWKAVTSTLPTS